MLAPTNLWSEELMSLAMPMHEIGFVMFAESGRNGEIRMSARLKQRMPACAALSTV
ncbi:hypothetical protein CUJ84_pRLN1000562 (plasmid) [Rhizobium leguminosarum]|uniref:Uncharacterized protein n=1 Tax=Rhizobium leguminosarum TaxID=384 RepID=A0A2K9ZCQ0_RHILE|nr:hypothetical protein CUJ84_pRLN1000562 [Rhizobium leguminosarum]